MTQELLDKLSELNEDSKELLDKLNQFNASFDTVTLNFKNMEQILGQVKKAFDLYKEVTVLINKSDN
ncbi:hypothetical protein THOM_0206 [Trachipleistophora hominis]|uniref:Uncharacterized protein n=1 Tax=Trachipleistophora hominis TaxID=72359 RepID=L7K0J0_TRAHO|nr:hypothetical protein THOM_0206 [Trachipleistophora hominis]